MLNRDEGQEPEKETLEELKAIHAVGLDSLDLAKRHIFSKVKSTSIFKEDFLNGSFDGHYAHILSGIKAEKELTKRDVAITRSLINELNEQITLPVPKARETSLLLPFMVKSQALLNSDEMSWLEILNRAKGESTSLKAKEKKTYEGIQDEENTDESLDILMSSLKLKDKINNDISKGIEILKKVELEFPSTELDDDNFNIIYNAIVSERDLLNDRDASDQIPGELERQTLNSVVSESFVKQLKMLDVSLGEKALDTLEQHSRSDKPLMGKSRENLLYTLSKGIKSEKILHTQSDLSTRNLNKKCKRSLIYQKLKLEREAEIKKIHDELALLELSINKDKLLAELKSNSQVIDNATASPDDSLPPLTKMQSDTQTPLVENPTDVFHGTEVELPDIHDAFSAINASNVETNFNNILDNNGDDLLNAHDLKVISICIDLDNKSGGTFNIEQQFKSYLQDTMRKHNLIQLGEESERISLFQGYDGSNSACDLYLSVVNDFIAEAHTSYNQVLKKSHSNAKSLEEQKKSEDDMRLKCKELREMIECYKPGSDDSIKQLLRIHNQHNVLRENITLFGVGLTSEVELIDEIKEIENLYNIEVSKRNEICTKLKTNGLDSILDLLQTKSTSCIKQNLYQDAHYLASKICAQLRVLYEKYEKLEISEEDFAKEFNKIVNWDGECGMQVVDSIKDINDASVLPSEKPHGYVFNKSNNSLYYFNRYNSSEPSKLISSIFSMDAFNFDPNSTYIELTAQDLSVIKEHTKHAPATPSSILGQHPEFDTLRAKLASFISKVCRLMNCPELAEKFAPDTKKKLNELRKAGQVVIDKVTIAPSTFKAR